MLLTTTDNHKGPRSHLAPPPSLLLRACNKLTTTLRNVSVY